MWENCSNYGDFIVIHIQHQKEYIHAFNIITFCRILNICSCVFFNLKLFKILKLLENKMTLAYKSINFNMCFNLMYLFCELNLSRVMQHMLWDQTIRNCLARPDKHIFVGGLSECCHRGQRIRCSLSLSIYIYIYDCVEVVQCILCAAQWYHNVPPWHSRNCRMAPIARCIHTFIVLQQNTPRFVIPQIRFLRIIVVPT